jgi:hypothetical protein
MSDFHPIGSYKNKAVFVVSQKIPDLGLERDIPVPATLADHLLNPKQVQP